MSKILKGIDVSDCNGKVDWGRVKAAGVEFAILRTTRRSGNPDTYLPTNIKGCKDNGILLDFYKYSYATTVADGIAEAKRVVEVLKSYGVVPAKNTTVYMDVEDKVQFALTTTALTNIILAWREVIEDSGFAFGLYMGKYYYESGEIDHSKLPVPAWIARYYKGDTSVKLSETPNEKYKPTAKSGELMGWQYTSKGIVDGIAGNVDLDIYYGKIYNTEVQPEYYVSPEFTLIDALNKIGVNSSYANRKKIAAANGIENYSGTAEQNLQMLELLNKARLIKI